VALWTDRRHRAHQIELAPSAQTLALTTALAHTNSTTADGRPVTVPELHLEGVEQIQVAERSDRALASAN
jgi:hypothetical protein